jgi:hypothetical protein
MLCALSVLMGKKGKSKKKKLLLLYFGSACVASVEENGHVDRKFSVTKTKQGKHSTKCDSIRIVCVVLCCVKERLGG